SVIACDWSGTMPLSRFTSARSAAISFVASAGFNVVGGVCGCAVGCDRRTAKLPAMTRHTVPSETFLKRVMSFLSLPVLVKSFAFSPGGPCRDNEKRDGSELH